MNGNLKQKIEGLDQKIGSLVRDKIKGFEFNRDKDENFWFNELCFCILTANSSATKGIEIQDYMERIDGFSRLPKGELSRTLKRLGHRFYDKRAGFIVEARGLSKKLKPKIISIEDEFKARDWLAKNVKGIGMKEASHFLRNVGYKNLAILDRHILRALKEHRIIKEIPKSLTRRSYLSIENKMRPISRELNLSLAELDLFLWYTRTGKVLK